MIDNATGLDLDHLGNEIGPDVVDVLVTKIIGESKHSWKVVINGEMYWLAKTEITHPDRVKRSHWDCEIQVSRAWVVDNQVKGYI
jgi:hypothetical protein